MTLDELESLRPGEVVVFTKVDEMITDYHEYEVGDELEFMDIYTMNKHGRDVVNFYRKVPGEMGVIAHFSYSICDYIERKVLLERDRKLNDILI
jgi:hypothetical protein